MKTIALESAPELFRGCVAPGVRMSPALLAFYGEPEKRLLRARCGTGVRLALITDASEIEFGFTFGGAARQIFTADLQVDGRLFAPVTGEGPHRIALGPGEKELVLHLPHLVVTEKFTFRVSDGAQVRPAPRPARKLLICGDSIMQGMTCTAPTKAVGTLLAASLGMDFHNTSVGGAVMSGKAVRETLALGGDAVVVGFGINDVFLNTPPEKFRAETEAVFRSLAAFPGKAFLVTPIPSLAKGEEPVAPLRQVIREVGKTYPRVTLIEGPALFPAEAGLFVDGTHPNDQGMAVYAKALGAVMGPELRQS